MKNKKRIHKFNGSSDLRVKLSFDEGFAERPIYVIKGRTTEKQKGINMIDLIKQNFNISELDVKKQLEEYNKDAMIPTEYHGAYMTKKIKWTTDSEGNKISPFSANINKQKEDNN